MHGSTDEQAHRTTLSDFGNLIVTYWKWPLGLATVGAIVGIISAFFIQPVYRAQALLMPVKDDGLAAGLGSAASQLGGLISMAGVSLPGSQDRNEAIAILRSRDIALRLIDEEGLLKKFFGDQWDDNSNKWRDVPPTRNDALDFFFKKVFNVRDDTKSGTVTVAIEWRNPVEAAKWANRIVGLVNEVMQLRAIAEADQSIDYLKREAEQASSVEVKNAVFKLIEAQLKTKTVAAVRKDYAFRIIDRALVPDNRRFIWPRKGIMGLGGLAVGFLLGACMSWLTYGIPKKQQVA